MLYREGKNIHSCETEITAVLFDLGVLSEQVAVGVGHCCCAVTAHKTHSADFNLPFCAQNEEFVVDRPCYDV